MDEIEMKSKMFFYLRDKHYHAMQTVSLEGAVKFPQNVTFKLLNAFAMVKCCRVPDGIREFETLQSEDELILACLLALIHIHKTQPTVEKEVLQKLDMQLKEIRKKCGFNEFYYAALLLFACEKYDKARDYIDKCLKLNTEHVDGIVLKGWIELYIGRNNLSVSNEIIHYFSTILNKNKRYADAAFGEMECYEFEKKMELALNAANKAVVRHPNMVESLVKKMHIQFAIKDWEQTIETMNRIINIDSINLSALKMNILILLCRDGNYDEAAECVTSFYRVLEKAESKNAVLFFENAQLFSRICGRSKSVLTEVYKFAEKAVQLEPRNSDFISELGYQSLLQRKLKDATRFYKSAAKVNEASIEALIGLTLCELAENGVTDQIHHQMEFILEMHGSRATPVLLLMQAKLASTTPDIAIKYLNEACDIHLKPLQFHPYGATYLKLLDPDFLLDVTKEYLHFSPRQSDIVGKGKVLSVQPNSVVKKSLTILKTITKACPGLQAGLYLLAKVEFLTGDYASAMSTLNHVLNDVNTNSADANLLMAQIYIQQGSYQRASQSLEMALSNDFKVRESPLYHFITGMVYKNENNIDETIKSLTTALNLIDTNPKDISYNNADKQLSSELTPSDKTTLYMELVNAYTLSGQTHEAAKIMENAMLEFKEGPEEAKIVIMNAEQALQKRDVKMAIELLNKVKPEEPYYIEAHTKLADVYLKHRRDRSAFVQCFREVVEHCPGPESYLLYGDACMSIQEPDRAIDAYERALNCNPKDPILASKMGIALVKTHQYNKAINYYKEAIKLTDSSDLKIDLANLYMKLKQYDKAEVVMQEELECNRNSGSEDFLTLQFRSKSLLLLSKVQEKSGNIKGALVTLIEAKDCQNRLQKRLPLEQSGNVSEQVRTCVEICTRMAELSVSMRDNEKAAQYYKEALSLNPTNSALLVALAKLYLQMNYLELCQQTCSVLLKTDPENEAASVMMADLAFRKIDFDTASFHFKQILNKQPTYWTALARLIEVMRRTGNLVEIPAYLRKAEEMCDKPKDSGLAYCVGLHEWYSGNPNAALRYFNNARQDAEWGQQAIYNMIEICLNPEDEMVGAEAFDNADDLEYRDSRTMALRTAERLLKELKPRPGGIDDEALRHRILGNFLLLATKQKSNIELALDDFTALASQETFKEHIGPILGVASAHTLLKQTQRARNQLKRVAKNVWTFEDAEYLERCWLLLADIYVQSAKYDLAMDLLRRVLQHNKTCTKAYEFCGYVAEKEQHYKEAASHYDSAWKYGGKGTPAVGYKLAFCHMKCKKYADAIDVCNQVLKAYPDYPKIKKDIYDKSLNNLRT